jgi:quinone-modifying oxidoreductase subunit QmoA
LLRKLASRMIECGRKRHSNIERGVTVSEPTIKPDAKPVLVIGGGIGGVTAALEAAEVGYRTILVEREPNLGGRVARLHQYFPKMCPPTCGMEINIKRIRQNPRVTVHTLATVEKIEGVAGNFKATIKKRPRYVTGRYSLDATHVALVESERDDEFNLGMCKQKALYLPYEQAYPPVYTLDRQAISDSDLQKLMAAVPEGAIDPEQKEETLELEVGAVIIATGWKPYDANKLDNLGFGKCANVITNAQMERKSSANGPTGGKLVRPSDGETPKSIAFVQCAGSRDENHLPYCSAVCCMGSLKQARYVRAKAPDCKITIFYIDIRPIGRHEEYYRELLDDENIRFVKGKVAKITEDGATKGVVLEAEETMAGEMLKETFDMAVLATGMVSEIAEAKLPIAGIEYDEYGFIAQLPEGVSAVGCAKAPVDVMRTNKQATAAALRAIQAL